MRWMQLARSFYNATLHGCGQMETWRVVYEIIDTIICYCM